MKTDETKKTNLLHPGDENMFRCASLQTNSPNRKKILRLVNEDVTRIGITWVEQAESCYIRKKKQKRRHYDNDVEADDDDHRHHENPEMTLTTLPLRNE